MRTGAVKRRIGALAIGVAVLSLLTAIGILAFSVSDELIGRASGDCTATVGGHTVQVSGEQAENASLIAAIALRRGLPARAVSIALATAYQESKLLNIDYGDRDSLGLFQQRPSQGWGSPDQVQDPAYATNAFYDALVKVDGYEKLEITDAAQRVQRSAFPRAYADHEADGRALASALTGFSRAAFTCDLEGSAPEVGSTLAASGLTARADTVRAEIAARFGNVPVGGFAPGGVRTGHMAGSAHYDGRAVDVFVRPISKRNKTRGWAIAHWAVANAARLQIRTVIFDDRIWTAGRDGWRDYDVPSSSRGDLKILEHRDHVHIDVYR